MWELLWFCDCVILLVINNVSVFLKMQLGGYVDNYFELEQFLLYDDCRLEVVVVVLIVQGLQLVWKDWDSYLGCVL